MIRLIKNAEVFTPEPIGKKDVLFVGSQICQISEEIAIEGNVEIEIIEGQGKYLFPGFIDNHVHITGGGGEGGFGTRTPEIGLTDIIDGGITTIIGTLGTDGFGRNMTNLIGKANGIENEGITVFVNTGSYQVPVKTFTGSISNDIMFIDKIIGVGEIAVSDHRSSCPTVAELEKIVSEVRVAGMLSGKIGIVNVHVGDESERLEKIKDITARCKAYKKHFHPTHINRSYEVFEDGLDYLKMGGSVDFTTSTTPLFLEEGEVACADGVLQVIKEGLDISKVTLSSDGQGSLPVFDKEGNVIGIEVGRVTSLYGAVRECIQKNVPIEIAISLITSNPATIYGLKKKGFIKKGSDADMVLVDKDTLEIDTLIAKGEILKKQGKNLKKGAFE
ncbi:beta-aspartyl-peptidase [Aminipila sp.]|uniref:beta-aspartyl-peptidase n=1 Tax=Aminipila sp. TaxID=2060095 RepID=UPI00289EFF76|nr:beta-aspartyl-peptidase [Aminipila sp.]